jgi:glycosyltransferase involved in cell wall biosynthesis
VKTEKAGPVKIIRLPASNLYWVGDKDRQPGYKKVVWQLIDTWNPAIHRLARQVFLDEAPDVVHSHKLRGLSPSIWRAAADEGVKKIIHTCHDFELLSPEGLFMGRVGRLAQNQSPVMFPYQEIRRRFSRLVNRFTAPSEFIMSIHKKMGFFPRATRYIVPNSHGFNLKELAENQPVSRSNSRPDGARRFLYIGRLDKTKGVDLLCQVFSKFIDQNLVLTLAGWGPAAEYLQNEYGGFDNIRFAGAVFGERKAELFRDCDVLIAPSLAPESFGIVIAEAYAYGLPVIASRIGAFPELVQDGVTGFLVSSGSAGELSDSIMRIGSEIQLYREMSSACFEKAGEFSTENIINGYLQVYSDDRL